MNNKKKGKYFDEPKHPHIVYKYEGEFKKSFAKMQKSLSKVLIEKLKSYAKDNRGNTK